MRSAERPIEVLVLTPALHGTSPGQRFRIEQWAPHLEKRGFHFTFAAFEDEALHEVLYRPGQRARKAALMGRAYARRLGRIREVRKFDVVYLYREAALIGPALLESRIARAGVPIVYDFDDPIWLPYRSPSNGAFSLLKWPSKTARICEMATVVTVGNRLLGEYAREHSASVEEVPSTIDLEAYPVPAPVASIDPATPPTLAWTGSHSTLPFLESIREPLKTLSRRERFRLLVVSHTDRYRMEGVKVPQTSRRWNASTEAEDLQDASVGLAPFPTTGWTPWRCHGKVLQYMALGIAPVASSIGILPDYIRDNESGFLVASEEEWVDRLAMLIRDPDLRARLGAEARRTVESRFSATVWAPRVGEILAGAARR
jgi:glycosyltransferase involved in cell wall biosynthesis